MSASSDHNPFTLQGPGPLVIAEIGVNHDGDPDRAVELVDLAASAGADAVKVQWFRASGLLSSSAGLVDYQRDAGEHDAAGMLARLELDLPAMQRIHERIKEHGLLSIATVFSSELVDEASLVPWDMFKTASPDLVNRPLLERLATEGRPLILSTGGSTLDEIAQALEWVSGARVALLHCVSSYPTPPDQAAIGGIRSIADAFDLPVGYSDHTPGWETGGIAVAAGACMLEKHLTWDTSANGPDHACSLDPMMFERYVGFARASATMVGAVTKHVLPIERAVRTQARQSIAVRRDLRAGSLLRVEDLTTMRPGSGIKPACMPELIGARLVRDVKGGDLLEPSDLASAEACS
jgi:N-acetylneuraminate synthase/N,N'-diacetyllegionaminate synthase